MWTAVALLLVVVGVVLVPLGPWLARRLEWRDEGTKSSWLSRSLGLGTGRWWRWYRLLTVELTALAFIAGGLLVLLGVWDVSR